MKKLIIPAIFILIGIVCTGQQTTTAKTTAKTTVNTEELKALNEMRTNLEQMLVQYNKQINAAQTTMTKIEDLQKKLEAKMKELEEKDKLGRFEIQDLMSQYNQAETTTSNVLKKLSDNKSSVVRKIQ
jgi:chromosome segregation ATPase